MDLQILYNNPSKSKKENPMRKTKAKRLTVKKRKNPRVVYAITEGDKYKELKLGKVNVLTPAERAKVSDRIKKAKATLSSIPDKKMRDKELAKIIKFEKKVKEAHKKSELKAAGEIERVTRTGKYIVVPPKADGSPIIKAKDVPRLNQKVKNDERKAKKKAEAIIKKATAEMRKAEGLSPRKKPSAKKLSAAAKLAAKKKAARSRKAKKAAEIRAKAKQLIAKKKKPSTKKKAKKKVSKKAKKKTTGRGSKKVKKKSNPHYAVDSVTIQDNPKKKGSKKVSKKKATKKVSKKKTSKKAKKKTSKKAKKKTSKKSIIAPMVKAIIPQKKKAKKAKKTYKKVSKKANPYKKSKKHKLKTKSNPTNGGTMASKAASMGLKVKEHAENALNHTLIEAGGLLLGGATHHLVNSGVKRIPFINNIVAKIQSQIVKIPAIGPALAQSFVPMTIGMSLNLLGDKLGKESLRQIGKGIVGATVVKLGTDSIAQATKGTALGALIAEDMQGLVYGEMNGFESSDFGSLGNLSGEGDFGAIRLGDSSMGDADFGNADFGNADFGDADFGSYEDSESVDY